MKDTEVLFCALSRLIYSKLGCSKRILSELSNFEEIFSLSPPLIDELIGEVGIGSKLLSKSFLYESKKESEWYASKGVEIVSINSENYPPLLRECVDAPIILYFRGNCNLLSNQTLSIVGTRLSSDKGIDIVNKVLHDIAEDGYNPLITSGLAVGIDISAHRAALKNNLETLAILPCGIDTIYPNRHRSEAQQIVRHGGVLTEFPRGVPPLKHNFLQRNRIIAGISQGVLVVESRISGGSMSTVSCANSYSREIFAIPGRVDDINYHGCNYLISKNIAQIYLNRTTIPHALGWQRRESSVEDLFSTPDSLKEKILLTLMSAKKASIEEIAQMSGYSLEEVSLAMTELELERRVFHNYLEHNYSLKSNK